MKPVIKTESDLLKKAEADKVDHAELEDSYKVSTPTKFGLPTTWANSQGAVIHGQSQVVEASQEDLEAFSRAPRNVCGHCKFFDLHNGRRELVRQNFLERLVREEKWKLKHVGPVDSIGLCGASGGELAVTYVTPECDQFRPRKL